MVSKKLIIIALLVCGYASIVPIQGFSLFSQIEKVSETRVYPFTKGTLTVINNAGSITIESCDKNTIEITATKKAPESSLKDIIIDSVIKDNKALIETHFPKQSKANQSVDLIIKIPKVMESIKISMSAGNINIKDIDSPMSIENAAGALSVINATSDVTATISAGSITIMQKALPANSRIKLNAAAGSILLKLAPTVSAHVTAATTVGTIHSQFKELKTNRKFPYISSKLEGKLLTGAASIILETTTGSISIKKLN